MKKFLLGLAACLTFLGLGTYQSEVALAHVPSSSCSHWYVYSGGNYTGGMSGTCGTSAPGTQWALTITCTNGETKGTGLRAQGTAAGVACDPGHVVDTHSMILR